MNTSSNPYYELILHQSRYLVRLLAELTTATGAVYVPRVEFPPADALSHQHPKVTLESLTSQKDRQATDIPLANNLRLNVSLITAHLAYLLQEAHREGHSLCVGIPVTDSGMLLIGESNEPKFFTTGQI